jgi:hypothetical protein
VIGSDYYTMVSNLLGGYQINSTLFYQLLNIARSNREMERPWMRLRKLDSSLLANTGDTYLTAKALQSDFRRFLNNGTIRLFDGNNTILYYTEIPFESRLEHKDDNSAYYVDYANLNLYLTGKVDKQYQIHLFYIYNPGDITVTTSWLNFPSEFHSILAFDVAAMWRLGADYDDQNARMGDENGKMAEVIKHAMHAWDNELALSAVENLDYYGANQLPWRGGRVDTRS